MKALAVFSKGEQAYLQGKAKARINGQPKIKSRY